jgi:hypothetical protein
MKQITMMTLVSLLFGGFTMAADFSPELAVQIVRKALNQADPEKIIGKTNQDEYDVEVSAIAAFVFSFRYDLESYSTSLKKYINRVWKLYFHHDCSKVDNVVKEILKSVPKKAEKAAPSQPKKTQAEFDAAIQHLDSTKLDFFGVK